MVWLLASVKKINEKYSYVQNYPFMTQYKQIMIVEIPPKVKTTRQFLYSIKSRL